MNRTLLWLRVSPAPLLGSMLGGGGMVVATKPGYALILISHTTKMNTPKNTSKRLPKGHHYAAIWPNGRQLWADPVKRNVVRAAHGTSAHIVIRANGK